MFNLMKKLLVVFLVSIMLMSCMTGFVQASEVAETALQWDYILDIYRTLDFYNGVGCFSTMIDCLPDEVIEIEATATLYYVTSRGNWSKIDEWYYHVEDCYISIGIDFPGVSGREYVVQVDAIIYTENDSETFSYATIDVCP